MAKKNKREELDTETTFADMNVDGFKWYNPYAKKNQSGGGNNRRKYTRKETRQMIRSAFAAYLPVFIIVTLVFVLMAAIAWLWVG